MIARSMHQSLGSSNRVALPLGYWSKYLVGAALLFALILKAWCAYGHGAPEEIEKVLVISEHPSIHANWLAGERFGPDERDTFAAQGRTYEQALELGRADDEGLDELAAILRHADLEGFGFVAWRLADAATQEDLRNKQLASLSALEHAQLNSLPHDRARWIVLTVGLLSDPAKWTFGSDSAGIELADDVAERRSLLHALHEQPLISARRERSDVIVEDPGFVARRKLSADDPRKSAPWQAFDPAALSSQAISRWGEEFGQNLAAGPLEQIFVEVLADGSLLHARRNLVWQSSDGNDVSLAPSKRPTLPQHAFRFFQRDLARSGRSEDTLLAAPGLPDRGVVEYALGAEGDALSVALRGGGVETYAWSDADDGTFRWIEAATSAHDPSLDGLGTPHRSGASTGSYDNRLWWRKGSTRLATLPVDGTIVSPPQWLGENRVVARISRNSESSARSAAQSALLVQTISWERNDAPIGTIVELPAASAKDSTREWLAHWTLGANEVVLLSRDTVGLRVSRLTLGEGPRDRQPAQANPPRLTELGTLTADAYAWRFDSRLRSIVYLYRAANGDERLAQFSCGPTVSPEVFLLPEKANNHGFAEIPRVSIREGVAIVRRKVHAFGGWIAEDYLVPLPSIESPTIPNRGARRHPLR
jgi:hypothetical protein